MSQLPAGVAAGHPSTAAAGLTVLAGGGSAGDAAAAMVLAGSVAETIFCGLAGGGFATHFDASTGEITCHDFFVAVPGLDGSDPAPGLPISVSFGGVAVPYEIGGATVAVPGVPRGVEQLHRTHGRLPWKDLVEPAIVLARSGAPFPSSHADLLPDVQAAMLLGAGVDAYSIDDGSGGRLLLGADGRLFHPGLAETLERYRDGGADALMAGDFGGRFVAAVRAAGGNLAEADLAAYRVNSGPARTVGLGSGTVHLRGNDLDDVAGTFSRYHQEANTSGSPTDEVSRALALVGALAGPARRGDTTSLVAVDPQGNACAVTHSLGLGSGVWVDGVHANSMLGEGELIRGAVTPGQRMGSMMSPLVVTGSAGELLLAGGAAGGSRIRAALLQVVSSVVLEDFPAQGAVDRPRLSVAEDTVHLEPGFSAAVVDGLTEAGYQVTRWKERKPYFGGAAVAASSGFAGDPRRGGVGLTL
ncbi:gamma-glutamyltranspeptidase [Nakamurella silvestris]|nr:gamma-glutamyltranspeptidase [Nakamurella silvestris]